MHTKPYEDEMWSGCAKYCLIYWCGTSQLVSCEKHKLWGFMIAIKVPDKNLNRLSSLRY